MLTALAGTPNTSTAAALAVDASLEAMARQVLAGPLPASLTLGTQVYVPHPPGAPFEERRAACARLATAGFRPVPHVAAREVKSTAELDNEVGALIAAGADGLMLIGGGGAPTGPFHDVHSLISCGVLQERGLLRIGLAGHPEGTPFADRNTLTDALIEKLDLARQFADEVWVVTQFVFEAAPAIAWLEELRGRGEMAPVRLGIVGPASMRKLIAFAIRCGVGPSLRALRGASTLVSSVAGGWSPDELVAEISARPDLGVEALHLFSFGGLDAVADWIAATRGQPMAVPGAGGDSAGIGMV